MRPSARPSAKQRPISSIQLHRLAPIWTATCWCSAAALAATARFRAADLGLKVVWWSATPQLGGVCLNVGCIPSKALLHVAAVMDEVGHLSAAGIDFGAPQVESTNLRGHKEKVIAKLTGGLGQMAKMRKVTIVRGYGALSVPTTSRWKKPPAPAKTRPAAKGGGVQAPSSPPAARPCACLHARRPARGRFHRRAGAAARAQTHADSGRRHHRPGNGHGYSTLGARLDVVEMLDGLMQGADRDLVKIWQKMNATASTTSCSRPRRWGQRPRPKASRSRSRAEEGGPPRRHLRPGAAGRGPHAQRQEDRRRQGGRGVTDRGFINVDIQMRTNVPHIFAIGDIVGQPMLAHKAVHEAHVAAEVIAGELQGNKELAAAAFNARVIPSVAYTDPEVAWVGLTEDQAKAQGIKVKKGLFPWAASGPRHCQRPRRRRHQAAVRRQPRGPGRGHGKILGGGMVGTMRAT